MRRAAELLVASLVCIAGCGKGSPSSPPPGPAPAAATAPGWRSSLDGVAIPDIPASGKIHGEPFAVEVAEIENGILHLKQGKEFFADKEFTVFLFLKERGSVPENRAWNEKADKEFGHPHVHWGGRPAGSGMPKKESVFGEYSMKLEFGKETGKKLPGKIWLCMPGETKDFVLGTFVATVKGFILRNGEPDRTEDSLELLAWLAEERLKKENPGKKTEVTKSMSGNMSTGPKGGSGGEDVEWSLDGVKQGWLKFRFVRENGQWGVSKVWPGNQIPEAHPEKAPAPGDASADAVKVFAAIEIEKILEGKTVHVLMGFSPSVKAGVAALCEAQWQVEGEEEWLRKRLLFKWTEAGWVFDRMLGEGEQFNVRTGDVEKK
ncbi:MAG: hypothetical protein AAB074_05030 [Planctomycetota bacterium]